MKWSPQDAMEAYLQTLQLYKIHCNQEGTKNLIQPQCMEFISALAAGNQAKVMVQILSNERLNPVTIALAVAAKQTGGRFVCVVDEEQDFKNFKAQLSSYDLEDHVELVHGNPCEVIMQLKSIDFSVIDCKFDDYSTLFKNIDVNPSGSIVVVSNIMGRQSGASFGEVVRRKNGVECVTLQIGEGMELIRIGFTCKSHETRRCKRFHVTYES